MAEAAVENTANETPKESAIGFYIAILLATVIAVGTGWFLGGMLEVDPNAKKAESVAAQDKLQEGAEYGEKEDDGKKEAKAEYKAKGGKKASSNIVTLEPILVALRNSNNAFLRLELAIIMNEGAYLDETEGKLRLLSELSAFSKTMTLRQISGPSGYLHFREDLLDRAILSTKGGVRDLLILSMVAE